MTKLNISKQINIQLRCTIIPLLITHIDKETLYKYVSRYINIPNSYKTLLEQIENNMKHNNLNMTSFTIETKDNKKDNKKTKGITLKKTNHSKHSKHSKSSKNILKTSNIHQIFIIAINNHSYDKSKYDIIYYIYY